MKLRSPLLENCCCCISNRTGALIYGYLSLVGYIVLLLGSVVDMGFGIGLYYSNQASGENRGRSDYMSTMFTSTSLLFSGGLTLLVSVLAIVFTVMLINGIHKKSPHFMIPWLTLQIYASVYTFGCIVCILVLNVYLLSAIGVPLLVILLALEIYTTMVVFSYYQELNSFVRHMPLDEASNAGFAVDA